MVASAYRGVLADEAARQSCGWVQRETAALCEALAKASAGGRLRASAPAEVSFVRTGTRSAARSDDLKHFADWSAATRLAYSHSETRIGLKSRLERNQ